MSRRSLRDRFRRRGGTCTPQRHERAFDEGAAPYPCPFGVGVYGTQHAHFLNCRVCIGAHGGYGEW